MCTDKLPSTHLYLLRNTLHTLRRRAVLVGFNGNLPRTCHLSSSKKNKLREKLKRLKEKCHKDLIKTREEGNNEDLVYMLRSSSFERLK